MMDDERALRAHLLWMIEQMDFVVVPPQLFEQAKALLPEVADKIVKSGKLPVSGRRAR